MKTVQNLKTAALAAFMMASGAVSASAQITIETVTVGNVGNTADTSGYGSVGYNYAIGTYEVTNTQYAAFLNAVAATDTYGLYNTNMGSQVFGGITRTGSSGSYTYATKVGYENKPVTYVSFWDATRFANWLNNGQGSADTETGSYTLTSEGISANTITRNGGGNWVVASEDEWYKAAYYDPTKNSGAGGYWLHATQSDTLGANSPFTDTNGANYDDGDFGFANGGFSGPGTTDVGSYINGSSYYGTFDQAGNAYEWNESTSGFNRGFRGGTWNSDSIEPQSSSRFSSVATTDGATFGFRVVNLAPIPEPSTYGVAMGVMALGLVMLRRKKARGTS